MKLINLLIIISLTAICISKEIREMRRPKKTAAKTFRNKIKTSKRYNGEGSYENSYLMPGLKIVLSGKNYDDLPMLAEKSKLISKNICDKDKAGDGIEFIFENGTAAPTDADWKSFTINNKIPYRYLSSTVTYVNPTLDFKYIEVSALNDQKVRATIRINFPYKRAGWYINDEQGNELKDCISKNSLAVNEQLKKQKQEFVTNATNYISLMDQIKLLTENSENKDKVIKDLQDSIAKETDNSKTLTTKYNEIEKNRITQKDKITNLETDIKTKISELNSLTSQYESLNSSLENLKSENTKSAENLKVESDAAKSEYNSSYKKLLTYVPDLESSLTPMNERILKGDCTKFDELNRINSS